MNLESLFWKTEDAWDTQNHLLKNVKIFHILSSKHSKKIQLEVVMKRQFA